MRLLSAIGALLAVQACVVTVDEYPVGSGQIGDPCGGDTLCAIDLECISQSDGVPSGMCSRTCDQHGDCDGGLCLADVRGTGRICYVRCTRGDGDASKCRGRRDLGCLADVEGDHCYPRCGSDADCPGEFCGLTGFCQDTRPSFDTGLHCDCSGEDGPAKVCSGFCSNLGVHETCATTCVIGANNACGSAMVTSECIDLQGSNASVGDTGACARTCMTDCDCKDVRQYRCNTVINGTMLCGLMKTGELEDVPCLNTEGPCL